jgi:hypothetical protein
MATEGIKYDRVLNILRRSKPELTGLDDIEETVLYEIRQSGKKRQEEFNLFDYLFGWVYIRWVKISLVTVSVFFVGLFIYQQSLILRRISLLENQMVVTGSQFVSSSSVDLEYKLLQNKLLLRKLNTGQVTITKRQMEKFMDSYDNLEHKYQDLIQIIDDDPELRQMLEKKLSEKNKKKFNL